MTFTLPPTPSAYSAPSTSKLTPPVAGTPLLATGAGFHAHASRVLAQRSFEDDDALAAARAAASGGASEADDDDDAALGGEEESAELLSADPRRWKEQDHYAVLGLQHLRYKATPEQIKKAHRRKALRHHPDKKAGQSDAFFKCIAKAHETLSDPEKRRQFDSVDENVPDVVPTAAETAAGDFLELWTPVFEREGRFSRVQPVPSLGTADASKADVESFYNFWYNFDSWRSFEYLDKDAAEGSDSRDEKRHQEKKNKNERARRKKEDNARLRTIVDLALSLDPRIKAFKEAEKAAKAGKRGPAAAAAAPSTADKAAEAAAAAAAEKAAAESAAADKAAREAAKKAKEKAAKTVKKDKKAIAALVTTHNYFTDAPTPEVVAGQLTDLDNIFAGLEPTDVAAFKAEAEAASGAQAVRDVFVTWAQKVAGEKGTVFQQFK